MQAYQQHGGQDGAARGGVVGVGVGARLNPSLGMRGANLREKTKRREEHSNGGHPKSALNVGAL